MVPLGALVGVTVVAALALTCALAAVAALVVAKRRQDSYTSDGFGPDKVNGGSEQTIEMPHTSMGAGDAGSRPTSSSTLSARESTSTDV
jgi:hypothetical protein